ncbi:DUF4139 domain-containing protein [Oxalobacter formigenes]|uniref:DUF4139 domain-containing protein n=1 Tax=Oxalobacter formigenes OXCC13 TaxID=556269 RepID=C3XD25_OXAFO|nr:DUF4139 domain-containing protein [Oxalobacter formigenes]ARQ46958.1 hypothetical protein BRW83_2226 [Oxalobacter formigenes]EEO29034.1 hypothetical protein OFBG_00062 [Oxalobacter formigenes OXCC13]MCZ4063473.1 DUF4139 domain-containing protein [Oxalobacter formigenes]QDX32413.1 DUF4139 domain-containing protein [Oxalobacter formigenes]WAW01400.1 DUF4139 domain-containing protein [Oxalobacter formigenes]
MRPFRHSLLFSLIFVTPLAFAVTTVQTGKNDQKQVSLTIYERDMALVRDIRQVPMHNGAVKIRFADVSERIQPETVMLKDMSSGRISVAQIYFDNNLLSPQTLLESYVGKKVKVVKTNPTTGAETEEQAEVLSAQGGIVLKIGNRIETSVPGRIVYDHVPNGLLAKPVLTVEINSNTSQRQQLELDYLTNGIGWNANYVAQLNDKENRMNLSGWAAISNNSGSEFKNARVQLIAGNPNITSGRPILMAAARSAKFDAMPANNEISQESFADYHLYTLPQKVTLANNQTRQYSLLSANDVKVKKEWVLNGGNYYYRSRMPNVSDNLPVNITVTFRNTKGDRLGMPLPGGTVRFYQTDNHGNQQFLGESQMSHTPVNGAVSLKMGESFDVTGSRKQTEYKMLPSQDQTVRTVESAYEIVLKNAKNNSVTVQVKEPIPGSWQILQENHPHAKDGMNAVWNIKVPANGESTLNYRVRVE